MKAILRPGFTLALATLIAGPFASAAETAKPTLSASQVRGVGELARCQRATYINRVGRERLAPFLGGKEAMSNYEDMVRMQDYNRKLDAWLSELVAYFGQEQVLRLVPPDRPDDKAFLVDDSSNEAKARTVVNATAREANVCLSNEEKLRGMLAAPEAG